MAANLDAVAQQVLTEGDAFAALQELARTGRSVIDRRSFGVDAHRRLFDQLMSKSDGLDTVAQIRQVLRREYQRRGGDPTFDVPGSSLWASEAARSMHSCLGIPAAGAVRLRAKPWRPSWLPIDAAFPEAAVAAGLPIADRRIPDAVDADPFFTQVLGTEFAEYRTPAQRQAVRSAACLAAGATLIINLPTGSGKTEVALAPALSAASPQGVSVVFVPTVSLAQDMDRRIQQLVAMREHGHGTVAFTGDTPQSDRQRLWRAVAEGAIPVVITTPESGVGALRPALRAAAERGYLRYFVIDEAHLIRVWGTDFRPEFQLLAALRRELLSAAPSQESRLKTLLLSATFTGSDMQYLTASFSDDGRIGLVAANGLRPEPDYWAAHAPDASTRSAWVLDAVAHLPRPLFLYTSWVDDADEWVQRLQSVGYKRVARVTGAVPGVERGDVLRGLRGDDAPTSVDIVVATSAFGLGISFDDVRTVIHACLPESIDRLYQEVGRAGRDGAASVALCVWTDSDREKAAPLSRAVVIGPDKARARWQAMTDQRYAVHETRGIKVDLTAVPSHGSRKSDLNQAWNRATLALMARANFIMYETSDSDQVIDDLGTSRWIDRAMVSTVVGNLADPAVWRREWSRLAHEIHTEAQSRRTAVEHLLLETTRVCEVLAASFASAGGDLPFDDSGLSPVLSCGQCTACHHTGPRGARLTEPAPLPQALVDGSISKSTRWSGVIPVLVPPPATPRERQSVVQDFLEHALAKGVRMIAARREDPLRERLSTAHLTAGSPFFIVDYDSEAPWTLPPLALGVVGPLDGAVLRPHWLIASAQSVTFVLMADTTLSPIRGDRSMREMRPPNSLSLHEFLDEP